jgi:hypothetical protein
MERLNVSVSNPLLRTPLALIVDDSCPVINLTHYWIAQRHAWLARHRPSRMPTRGDGDAGRLSQIPQAIPADFAARWGEWCGEQGVQGKFSLVPYPAGVGRVDQGFPDSPRREYDAWMRAVHEILWPNFDITCEMLTHTRVADLATWQFTEAWEQFEWVDPPVEPLTGYIAAAMELLRNAGIPCEGVTSPGAFGRDQESAYARSVLEAALQVNHNPRPFYFLHVNVAPDAWPDVPLWHVDKEQGTAVASIVGCTDDWFGNWTGYDAGDPDRFISRDLAQGALPPVLARELPCVLVGHWPGFYFGGAETGFDVLKEVKRRLDAYDPDGTRTRWMKTSQIGHYWMARHLSDITTGWLEPGRGEIRIRTRFPTADFTLWLETACTRLQVNGRDLRQVGTRHGFQEGTFLVEGNRTALAFGLDVGETVVQMSV